MNELDRFYALSRFPPLAENRNVLKGIANIQLLNNYSKNCESETEYLELEEICKDIDLMNAPNFLSAESQVFQKLGIKKENFLFEPPNSGQKIEVKPLSQKMGKVRSFPSDHLNFSCLSLRNQVVPPSLTIPNPSTKNSPNRQNVSHTKPSTTAASSFASSPPLYDNIQMASAVYKKNNMKSERKDEEESNSERLRKSDIDSSNFSSKRASSFNGGDFMDGICKSIVSKKTHKSVIKKDVTVIPKG